MRFCRIITLIFFLTGGFVSVSFCAVTPIAIDQNYRLIWPSLSHSQKKLFIQRELEAYRRQDIRIEHSVNYYVNQLDGLMTIQGSLQKSIRELLAYIIINSSTYEAQDFELFYEQVINVYQRQRFRTYQKSFEEYTKRGVFRDFHENGNLMEAWDFYRGERNGEFVLYYPNGQLYHKVYYEYGQPMRMGLLFHEDGSLKEIEFYKNGVLDGAQKKFYPGGVLKGIVYFRDGLPVGSAKTYDANGDLILEAEYEFGRIKKINDFK